ncbi:hypothetical protein P3W55_10075, partial [Pseudomonas citronellolis]
WSPGRPSIANYRPPRLRHGSAPAAEKANASPSLAFHPQGSKKAAATVFSAQSHAKKQWPAGLEHPFHLLFPMPIVHGVAVSGIRREEGGGNHAPFFSPPPAIPAAGETPDFHKNQG